MDLVDFGAKSQAQAVLTTCASHRARARQSTEHNLTEIKSKYQSQTIVPGLCISSLPPDSWLVSVPVEVSCLFAVDVQLLCSSVIIASPSSTRCVTLSRDAFSTSPSDIHHVRSFFSAFTALESVRSIVPETQAMRSALEEEGGKRRGAF